MNRWERVWAEKVQQAELAVLLELFLDADKWIKDEDYFVVILCHV